jgi:thioredoxin reductase (NADPH)
MVFSTDVVIIGAGPSGLFGVFQCGMLGLKTHVIDVLNFIGGQCTALYPEKPIYDIPTYPSILAQELIEQLRLQAEPFVPTYHLGHQVISIERIQNEWKVMTNKGLTIYSKGILIATGGGALTPKRPPIVGIEAFEGESVFYAVHDRQKLFQKHIVIAGGGDSAVDWAVSLCEVASSVTMVHRRDQFKAAPENIAKLRSLIDIQKITLVTPYQLDSLEGVDGHLETVIIKNLEGERKRLVCNILLPFFGLETDSTLIERWGIKTQNKRIMVSLDTMETNLPGIFAIGDITAYPGKLNLILCSFSEVAIAAHGLRSHIFPDTIFRFEYSTTKGLPVFL